MRGSMLKLTEVMKREGLDAIILTKSQNQRYLEGFTGGDCYMVASPEQNFLIADSRYTEMAERECRSAVICPHRHPFPPFGEVIAKIITDNGFKRVGFEREHMTWGQFDDIMKALCGSAEMIATTGLVENIRAVKTPEETALLGAACRIADRALWDLLPCIKPGVSEADLKTELEYRLKVGGADAFSFDTMVLFGARASQPHANSQSNVYLRPGDFILIDYGASYCGYKSDTTRTFMCGRASDEQRHAYETVLHSQRESLALVRPGANGNDINKLALDIIQKAGYPPYGYGVGHGVGLEIHEEPFMRQNRDISLEANMTITIEPGIYIPGWGGIRIEDTVLVTEDGYRTLTSFPKELMEINI